MSCTASCSTIFYATSALQGPQIPPPLLHGTREALAAAMHSVFLVGIPLAIVMLAVALALPERPLRRTLDVPPGAGD